MSAARRPIVDAIFKHNVLLGQVTCSTARRRPRYLNTSSHDTGAAVTSRHALIKSKLGGRKTVSDFQELYEATKKKFQCKPYDYQALHLDSTLSLFKSPEDQ